MGEVQSVIVESRFMDYCTFCGKPTTDIHHLVYGTSQRALSDRYKLVIPVCRECHNDIHRIPIAGKMSKVIGQLAFESDYMEGDRKNAREQFRKIFGTSYL